MGGVFPLNHFYRGVNPKLSDDFVGECVYRSVITRMHRGWTRGVNHFTVVFFPSKHLFLGKKLVFEMPLNQYWLSGIFKKGGT